MQASVLDKALLQEVQPSKDDSYRPHQVSPTQGIVRKCRAGELSNGRNRFKNLLLVFAWMAALGYSWNDKKLKILDFCCEVDDTWAVGLALHEGIQTGAAQILAVACSRDHLLQKHLHLLCAWDDGVDRASVRIAATVLGGNHDAGILFYAFWLPKPELQNQTPNRFHKICGLSCIQSILGGWLA